MSEVLVTSQNASEYEPHCFSTEASTIGLPIGQWPDQIKTNLGNGLPLVRGRVKLLGDEVAFVDYRQTAGIVEVRIHND